MATMEECREALEKLASRITNLDPEDREKHLAERTVSCRVRDLDVVFWSRMGAHGLDPIGDPPPGAPRAQIRLTATSDDLVALAEERLGVGTAWATGRLKIEANPLDLFRMRKLL
ncbi:MAG: SCP2 sterol-binding domain-containing protein [Actinobacteria bacterium]|nr:SCP2 sterol-binding domain-containing protein [Actinomycetota bacterium]